MEQQKQLNEMNLAEVESLMWRQEQQIKQCQQNLQVLNERRKGLLEKEVVVERIPKEDDSDKGKAKHKG